MLYRRRSLGCLLLLALALALPLALARAESVVVRHGSREERRVALTVDDCYDRKHIAACVALCEEYGVPLTFFPIGNALKFADGPLWQRAIDAGCEIGNHTWGHKRLTGLSDHDIRFQLLRIQQKVDEMLGYHYPMQVMRPPMGKTNTRVVGIIGETGYPYTVKWDVSQTVFGKVIKDVQNGSILLFHGRKKDVTCLEKLIPWLLAEGYECVTVSDMLGMEPVATGTDIYTYSREDR